MSNEEDKYCPNRWWCCFQDSRHCWDLEWEEHCGRLIGGRYDRPKEKKRKKRFFIFGGRK